MKRRTVLAIIVGVFMMIMTGTAVSDAQCGVFSGSFFILQGHRGLSNQFPENTIVSFEAAAKVSMYRGIETDVQETSDGVLVLFHDSKLDKVTDAEGTINSYSFEEVQQIKIDYASNVALYPDEKIPVLEDYLRICKESKKIPYIELKQLSDAGMDKLIKVLDDGGWEEACVITTFQKEYITAFRAKNSSYPIEYMIDKKEEYDINEVIAFLNQFDNMVFRPNAYKVTRSDVIKCSQNGIRVESYGLRVGDKEGLSRLKRIGVKGVTCNDFAGLE